MKFLVTGGAGFIGSHLCKELVKRKNEVIVVDNLHTGSLDNLKEIKDKIKFINKSCGEITSEEIGKIDGIFHLGIYSSSPMYRENKKLVGMVINDFINILELAKKRDTKIVFASSSSVYNNNPTPWKEEMNIKITDFYTEARYLMERLAKLYDELYNVKSVGLRLFSVYGPNEKSKGKYANLVSQFLWDMEKNKSPIVYGNGEQRRDFIYVDDVSNAFIRAMDYNKTDIFNVGTGKDYSLNELISMLNDLLGKNIKPKYIKNPIKNYVYKTKADTTKAKKLLNFEYTIDLKDGIKRLINI
ncbi:MAG: NAD-dependent epimerase/dehydratase family protein [Candidatus Aenigmarchaeota archaeon]|nr:NAD-dependent epimerase/dehydratase family protein [Candidatus Aenigmarchaeota archaeon]